tara:strand:- start:308 stop:640 length:333 start_codon:yes stop_codon:yes gene_type:complete
MPNKKIKDIFDNQYSELPDLLEENGITTLELLNQKVFNENGMYFVDILGYDIKDNERIKNILRMENTEDVLESFVLSSVESRFGNEILKPVILLLIVFILILSFIIFLII